MHHSLSTTKLGLFLCLFGPLYIDLLSQAEGGGGVCGTCNGTAQIGCSLERFGLFLCGMHIYSLLSEGGVNTGESLCGHALG